MTLGASQELVSFVRLPLLSESHPSSLALLVLLVFSLVIELLLALFPRPGVQNRARYRVSNRTVEFPRNARRWLDFHMLWALHCPFFCSFVYYFHVELVRGLACDHLHSIYL